MTDEPARPDPDALLAATQAADARAARGRLKIFFGASAGVGKTWAMLNAAQRLREQQVDVVVGVIETHGRSETALQLQGLEQLPRRPVPPQGRSLSETRPGEFDLDAALARRPAVLLVDELAHSNAGGSRHPKRWQDIDELLDAGIDVWTTVNVQHIESLNDVVGGITGIRVRETVPDHVFDEAGEVVLVDLPTEDLLRRLSEGKVYLPEQAERAVQNFFRRGNLMALRELALRRTAERVDDEVRSYRAEPFDRDQVWKTEGALLCVHRSPTKAPNTTVRSAAQPGPPAGNVTLACGLRRNPSVAAAGYREARPCPGGDQARGRTGRKNRRSGRPGRCAGTGDAGTAPELRHAGGGTSQDGSGDLAGPHHDPPPGHAGPDA
jgi:two-component system sensor histidine kinase KdpD